MMRVMLLLSLFIFSEIAIAQVFPSNVKAIFEENPQKEKGLSECYAMAEKLGEKEKGHTVNHNCRYRIATRSNFNVREVDKSQNIIAKAHKNILILKAFIDGGVDVRFLAGPETGLKNIRSLDFNESKEEIFVLHEKRVSVFATKYSGNVAPLRTFELPVEEPVAVRVSLEEEEVYILSLNPLEVSAYSLYADEQGRRDVNDSSVQRSFQVDTKFLVEAHDFLVDKRADRLLLLDAHQGKVFSFPQKSSGELAPLSFYHFSDSEKEEAKRIVWDFEDKNLFYILGPNKKFSPLDIRDFQSAY